MKINKDFLSITKDILDNPDFEKMKEIPHHGKNNNTYEHSLTTALFAYKTANLFHLQRQDVISTTRAALLHDFFCYDWRKKEYKKQFTDRKGVKKIKYLHCFIHPQIASENAEKYFNISDRQLNAIQAHMFPLSSKFPKYKESWLVTLADKVIATEELFNTCLYALKIKRPEK